MLGKQTVSDGLSGGNGPDARRDKTIHVFGADLQSGVVAKKMIARGQAADDDDVLPEVLGNRSGNLFQNGTG